jgi:SEC-C motif-containing protein
MSCPCGSAANYNSCCEPYITGEKLAPTAEALMRSRYTAHVKKAMPYLRETLALEARKDYDETVVKEWAEKSEWIGLEILSTKNGKATDKKGEVEFVAKYKADDKLIEHHEVSQFRKDGERWYFVDGEAHTHADGEGHGHSHETSKPVVRDAPKVGRNDPCSCGSGKKFKKCCGL